jgi:hypothetical protein
MCPLHMMWEPSRESIDDDDNEEVDPLWNPRRTSPYGFTYCYSTVVER